MWTAVCKYSQLEPGRGVAALVEGEAVAVFRLRDGSLYAVGNLDPFCGASVISRGITGMRGDGTATVASPMYKDVFDLATGVALDAPDVRLPVFAVRRHRGVVWVAPDVTSQTAAGAELLTEPTLVT
ncbi:nitrite reductase small subunit NirD [Catenulispora pinisilvae]|uniref:nitrite reductase small subunit NirD n=1 Tax=Catenulispora pinisilvae TaxID=2705253 RepID=UPI0018927ED4|nr:nitrite reductase small subunit NirD [Catenulispora pinisilvae]